MNLQIMGVRFAAGPLEFIFVMEGPHDLAVSLIRELLDKNKGVVAQIVYAGLSTSCSQKICNLQRGVQVRHCRPCSEGLALLAEPPSALTY